MSLELLSTPRTIPSRKEHIPGTRLGLTELLTLPPALCCIIARYLGCPKPKTTKAEAIEYIVEFSELSVPGDDHCDSAIRS